MKIFDIRNNETHETSSKTETAKAGSSNAFSTLVSNRSGSGIASGVAGTSNSSFFMNFMSQTFDTKVLTQTSSNNEYVTKNNTDAEPKQTKETKEDNFVKKDKNDDQNVKEKDDVKETDKTKKEDNPKDVDSKSDEKVSKESDTYKDTDNNEDFNNNNDIATDEVSNETNVDNAMQDSEDVALVVEVENVLPTLEEAGIKNSTNEDGTKITDDLLEEAAPSSKGNIGDMPAAPLSEDGTTKNNNLGQEQGTVVANPNADVEQAEVIDFNKQVKTETGKVTNTEGQKTQHNNLGVELASMTEDTLTDQQAKVISEALGEDFKNNVKVEVKKNTSKQKVNTEEVASKSVNVGEELNVKQEVQKTSDKGFGSSETSSKGNVQSIEQTTSNGGENSNALNSGQNANNANLSAAAVANNTGQTSSKSFAEAMKTASDKISNITNSSDVASKQNAQANDNVQNLLNAKMEKTSETANTAKTASAATTKQKPSVVTEQIKVSINKALTKEADNIKVELRPKELGRIDVKMEITSEGKLSATISASRPETLDILQRDARNLEKAFADAGFQTDSSSLNFDFKGNQSNSQNQGNLNGNTSNFSGLEADETAQDFATSSDAENYSYYGGGRGVNIKV